MTLLNPENISIWPVKYFLVKSTNASVQFSCSVVSDSATPWTIAGQASLSITKCGNLPKPMSIESVMPSNYLILCHPVLLLPSIFPSIRVFSDESALHIRWPEYWWVLNMFKLEKSSIGTFKGTQTLVTHPRYRYFSTWSHYKQTSKGHKDFPGGPGAKTPYSQCREPMFNP